MARSVLIVRLGALGDLVHALPAVAALRDAWPEARIDWLVEARHRALLDMVPVVDHVIAMGGPPAARWNLVRSLRRTRYDTAVDLQGLIKSAAIARLAGARETVGFATPLLRERAARLFYTAQGDADATGHVIAKNMRLLRVMGIESTAWRFPLTVPPSDTLEAMRGLIGAGSEHRFAVINPGAGWSNKRWPPERFGRVARHLRRQQGWPSVVLWGPGERELAETVVAASDGAARIAPPTGLGDAMALIREAALVVSGDTGPLHLAAALGTPTVGIFGPTNPARNGPWSETDVALSRFDQCECHHKRRCRRATACIEDIGVDDVIDAVDRRCQQVMFRG